VNNVYKGTPRTCYPCHTAEYARTTIPPHAASNFPTTCDSCHNAADSTWLLGKMDHSPYFPITSGRHANIQCTVCHISTTTYATFSCLNGCHQTAHNRNAGPTGCYNCHPTGRAG
jgi:hypothetical protein